MAGTAKGTPHGQTIFPLKICAKYNPPAVAILYARSQKSSKKYLHVIQLPTATRTSKPQELYDSLARNEPLYFRPDTVPEKQLLRVLEQIVQKLAQAAPRQSPPSRSKPAPAETSADQDKGCNPHSNPNPALPDKAIEDLKRGLHTELQDAIAEDARIDEKEATEGTEGERPK